MGSRGEERCEVHKGERRREERLKYGSGASQKGVKSESEPEPGVGEVRRRWLDDAFLRSK